MRQVTQIFVSAGWLIYVCLVIAVCGSQRMAVAQDSNIDYAKFLHSTPNHKRMPCLLCHRRPNNSPRQAMPGNASHTPCIGCHAQQLASAESPMCTICHTDVSSGAIKSFPPLRSFRVSFDHARHLRMGGVSCATCHRPARGGVAFTIPARVSAHSICFGCHSPRAKSGGRDISSCGTCHKPGSYSRTRQWTTAFNLNFSHARHRSPQELDCNDCHKVRPGLAQRRQVTTPEPANHHASGRRQSCMTCHDGKRAFGGDNFADCKRCHTGTAWRF